MKNKPDLHKNHQMGQEIKLKDLETQCKASFLRSKNQLIFDETGNAHVYFSHKNYLIDLNKLFHSLQHNRLKPSHVIDQIRRGLITCMKTGNRIVFLANQKNAERFMHEIEDIPWKELMQFHLWRQQYKQFLKPEENVDFIGT